MNPKELIGCGTALITPFRNGEVDYDAYTIQVKRQVDEGIHFLVALGSTAETPCLTDDEKVRLLELTRSAAPDTLIVAGVGTNSLIHTIHNIRLLSAADAYLVVVPYYNKPTQEGLYQYFKAVAESTDKPIILYNVPGRTATNMNAQTTLRLAQIPNIIGIKEASGNLEQIRTIIEEAPKGFKVLSGNDDQTLDIISFGGHGVISVASNIMPRQMAIMTRAAIDGDYNTAMRVFRMLISLFDACFVESNPIPVKAAMNILGLSANEMRLPLVPCEKSTYQLMEKVINKINSSWTK